MEQDSTIIDNNARIEPDELPNRLTKKAYLHYYVSGCLAGMLTIHDSDATKYNSDMVLLCEADATFNIPSELNIKGLALKSLQEEKERVLADNHLRLKAVQDKIDQLLAIEYKPEAL